MTRGEATDRAVRAVCRGLVDDLAAGRIDADTFAKYARRRGPQIAEAAAALMNPAPPQRCRCGAVATTTVNGAGWCEAHAKDAPRRERPAVLR